MKKIIILIVFLLLLNGCTQKENTQMPTEYFATYHSIEIKPGTFFNNLIATIGEYNSFRIEESSYYEGESTIYEYDTFEVETYYDDNIEKIYSITFTSDEQLTNEGIKIGDTKERMLSVYKDNYTNNLENIFIYNLSNTNISFTLENDIIIGIVYYMS